VWTPVLFCVRLPSSFLAMLLCGDCHAKFLLAVLALLHSIEVGFGRRSDVERISAAGSLREEHADVRSQSLAKSDPPDPFAGFNLYGPWTAENTGCTKTGWKGKYTIFNGQMDMLTVDVGDSSTTFAFNPDLVAQAKSQKEDTMVGKWFLMEGPIANEKVEDLFCTGVKAGTVAFRLSVQKLCSFWSPASLAKLCKAAPAPEPSEPSEPDVETKEVKSAKSTAEKVEDFEDVSDVSVVQDPFDGVQISGLWSADSSNGCVPGVPGNWSGSYFAKKYNVVILKVDIDKSSTTFKFWDHLADRAKRSDHSNKLANWFRSEGPYSNNWVQAFFCGDGWDEDLPPSMAKRAVSMAAKACAFWSSSPWEKC